MNALFRSDPEGEVILLPQRSGHVRERRRYSYKIVLVLAFVWWDGEPIFAARWFESGCIPFFNFSFLLFFDAHSPARYKLSLGSYSRIYV